MRIFGVCFVLYFIPYCSSIFGHISKFKLGLSEFGETYLSETMVKLVKHRYFFLRHPVFPDPVLVNVRQRQAAPGSAAARKF